MSKSVFRIPRASGFVFKEQPYKHIACSDKDGSILYMLDPQQFITSVYASRGFIVPQKTMLKALLLGFDQCLGFSGMYFTKRLALVGIGYRAYTPRSFERSILVLNLGFWCGEIGCSRG